MQTYLIEGKEYYSLWELAGRHFPSGRWQISSQTVTITGQQSRLELTMDDRRAVVNGARVWLAAPPKSMNGRAMVSKDDALGIILPAWRWPSLVKRDRGTCIVLDPGHGGENTGARSRSGLLEKDLVLDICLRAEKLLVQEGFRVILTRRNDVFIPLEKRAEMANNLRAKLFVSIHLNWARDSSVSGVETYCLPPAGTPSTAASGSRRNINHWLPGNSNDAANALLADYIHRAVVGATASADRGVRRARFVVLSDVRCPAVLLEGGFLSNPSDERRFADPAYRQLFAEAVVTGITNYWATCGELALPPQRIAVKDAGKPTPSALLMNEGRPATSR